GLDVVPADALAAALDANLAMKPRPADVIARCRFRLAGVGVGALFLDLLELDFHAAFPAELSIGGIGRGEREDRLRCCGLAASLNHFARAIDPRDAALAIEEDLAAGQAAFCGGRARGRFGLAFAFGLLFATDEDDRLGVAAGEPDLLALVAVHELFACGVAA